MVWASGHIQAAVQSQLQEGQGQARIYEAHQGSSVMSQVGSALVSGFVAHTGTTSVSRARMASAVQSAITAGLGMNGSFVASSNSTDYSDVDGPRETILKSTATGDDAEVEHEVSAQMAMLAVLIIFVALLFKPILESNKIYTLPVSGCWIVIGALTSAVWNKRWTLLNPEIFYYLLIPPIIFNAGYMLEHGVFFRNMLPIAGMAYLGTLISAVTIGVGLLAATKFDLVPLNNDASQSFMIGALLSSTDPIGVLSVIGSPAFENVSRGIKTVILGESILNDVVAITLFKTFENSGWIGQEINDSSTSGSKNSQNKVYRDVMFTFARFVYTTILSVITGIAFGLGTSSISLKFTILRNFSKLELVITFVSAYLCYCIAEITEASGMLSVFVCGLVLSHYHKYNISKEARITSNELSAVSSLLSEAVVYIFLGMTAARSIQKNENLQYNFPLIFLCLGLCLMGRGLAVFLIGLCSSSCSKGEGKIGFPGLLILWAMAVRGAIPFALAIQIPTTNRELVVTTTLAIVIGSTFLCGIMIGPLSRCVNNHLPGNNSKPRFSMKSLDSNDHYDWGGWADVDRLLSKYFGGKSWWDEVQSQSSGCRGNEVEGEDYLPNDGTAGRPIRSRKRNEVRTQRGEPRIRVVTDEHPKEYPGPHMPTRTFDEGDNPDEIVGDDDNLGDLYTEESKQILSVDDCHRPLANVEKSKKI